jgi:CheY-like chemotaxis protein
MPFRVREILLVSSPYDAFILEEDGRLTERLFVEYSELNLTAAPRITHVSTGARAMELILSRRFDLVITMVRLEDVDVRAFGRRVKEQNPQLPIVLLSLHESDLRHYSAKLDPSAIDGVFVWTGDARILLAVIKLIEDKKNVEHDTRTGDVRVIVVVEDSIRHYSSFLSLLYGELMKQSASLIAEGVNEAHKLMRMRARPKIVLATTFEEASARLDQLFDYVLAVISDVRFRRGGREDPSAGFELVRRVRAKDPDLPILLQSSEAQSERLAAELGVLFIHKNSKTLGRQIRGFLRESLGFGEFIFRLPDRTEVGRSRDMFEMERVLATVPAPSLEYHASRNHFSIWFVARSMFHLAELLRSRTIREFGDIEAVRAYLLDVIHEARIHEHEGMITDFSVRQHDSESLFVRVGKGSIGGKARGIAFVNSLLARHGMRLAGIDVRTPRTVAIGTDEFERFMEDNGLVEEVHRLTNDRDIILRFFEGRLSDTLERDLEVAFRDITGPFAVRSSSLLEDAQFQPFAGIYATYMLPNNHPNPEVRLDEVRRAIKAVYASTFSKNARSYFAGTPHSVEDEKMGVIIEEVVGRPHGPRFYPHVSGVALSYNFYPVGYQRSEDGLALVALGLGQIVVLGGKVLQFSLSTPGASLQFSTPADFLRDSQSSFYALDLATPIVDFVSSPEASLRLWDLSAAEDDGALALVGSVYSAQDDQIRDTLRGPGPRLVTFNNILKWNAVPLVPALRDLLRIVRQGMGCPVEIEFALDMGDSKSPPCLYVLQVRPQAAQLVHTPLDAESFEAEDILCKTSRSLGHGVIGDVRDIVYVKGQYLDPRAGLTIAAEVGEMNAELEAAHAPYLLVGPGRWGSSDARLGIPAGWAQIAGARVIVETPVDGRTVEPSQGSHFFHNITSLQIGYLTLNGHPSSNPEGDQLDTLWLDRQPSHRETTHVRHIRLEQPLHIVLDGKLSTATVLKRRR